MPDVISAIDPLNSDLIVVQGTGVSLDPGNSDVVLLSGSEVSLDPEDDNVIQITGGKLMPAIVWDQVGERVYETGVDHGVLYIPSTAGVYDKGYAWNGLVSVSESPTGAEATPQYADNIKYLNLISAEEFGATIEAFTYPDEFMQCDGTAAPADGVFIGQQTRKTFGLSYRTRIGNDIEGTDAGYKLHLVYGALAAPTEKAYTTINDSPEAITFSWEVTTTAVDVPGFKPSATVTIDSTKVEPAALAALEAILYGAAEAEPKLPLPAELIELFDETP